MNNVLRIGKRIFTVSVVVTTLAWSIGLASLLLPLAASAATLSAGDLIKASQPAVYYYGADGKRYVFPNEKTYFTWYSDFSGVKKITDAELAAVSIGGNVTYRPGVKMVKITTDPKVYAVDSNGSLRWVNSEQVAAALYGANWARTSVEDVSDAFFVNYRSGADVAMSSDFNKAAVMAAAVNINVDKGLASATPGAIGALSLAADIANPGPGSIVNDTSVGQRRADMLKVKLSAGAGDVHLTSLKFTRSGISKDGDVDNVYVMKGAAVVAESTSVSSGVATFNFVSGDLTVPANSSVVIDLAMDLNKSAANGSTMNWSLASANVGSDASSVSGSALGNTMTVVALSASTLGVLNVGVTNIAPSSVDPGSMAKEMWRLSFAAQSQDILLTYVKMVNLGSAYDADIQNIKLMDGATQLNGVVAQSVNKAVVFDLSNMTGGGYKILAGQTKQLTLIGDVVSGTSRTFKWTIQKSYDVHAMDLQYNVNAFIGNNSYTAFSVITQKVGGTETATSINTGTLSVGVNTLSPSNFVPLSATNVTLSVFDFKANGEDVKVTDLTATCTASNVADKLKNTKVLMNGVQVGSTNSSLLCDGATTAAYTFGNSFIIPAGTTAKISLVSDLTDTTMAAGDTVFAGFNGSGSAQGRTSLTALTPTAVNGRTLTMKTGTPTVIMNQSFSNRTSTFPTGVTNAQGVKLASFVVIAGAGEGISVTQFQLQDPTATCLVQDFQNLLVKDSDGNQVGTTISALNALSSGNCPGTGGTYTFTPSVAIQVPAGGQKAFDVFADIKGSPTNVNTSIAGAVKFYSLSATGVTTGASANDSTALALQNAYISSNGSLTITVAADTPVAQQQVLGTTGLSFAKFKLAAGTQEDINVTQLVVEDDMSTGFALSGYRAATGTLKNLKLWNGSTLLASVASLDETYNSQVPNAVFTGFNLKVPANQNVVLTVSGDLSSYTDGGVTSSTHRIILPVDWKLSTKGIDDPVIATGAGSGFSISSTATASQNPLHIVDTTLTDANGKNSQAAGNYMDMVRTKLTLAYAADTPKGAANAATEQVVAKFVATNTANVGNYSLTLQRLNFVVSSTGNSITGASTLKVYKDAVGSNNSLLSSDFGQASQTYTNTGITSDFTAPDLEVAAGSSRTIVVTINTANGGFGSSKTLSVGLGSVAGIVPIKWSDGVNSYFTCDSLPLAGNTLVY